MLNQRRGGQPGYMPPSSNPQQVDTGTLGLQLISKGYCFKWTLFHIQNISAVHWQTAIQEQIIIPVTVLLAVRLFLRMHQSSTSVYHSLGKTISQTMTM